jgi:hypothetical protein
VFAVRVGDDWLSWDDVVAHAKSLDMLPVPVLFRGTFNNVKDITDFFESEISKPSMLGGPREGFVMRYAIGFTDDYFTTCTSKYVRRGHVQTDEHWTRNWQPAPLIRI